MTEVIEPQIQSGKSKRMLAFNEPDNTDQSNLSLDKVVEGWAGLATTKAQLGSIATLYADNAYMQSFMDTVSTNCLRLDFITVHWYGGANAASFKTHVTNVYKMYGRKYKLFINEFAPADWTATTVAGNKWSQAKVLDFMKEVVPWLESKSFIMAYAWFPFKQDFAAGSSSALFDLQGNLTPLGKYYRTVTTENPSGDRSITV
jgi:Glycosyl hydrolase catalytic core